MLKKSRFATHTENIHYKPEPKTSVKCDASRSGFGEALERLTADGWKPILIASIIFNSNEERYSMNEI